MCLYISVRINIIHNHYFKKKKRKSAYINAQKAML